MRNPLVLILLCLFSCRGLVYVSPLENGKDYRLEVKRDLVQERRDFLAFIRRQFEDDPQLGLPSRTIHAVLIPVDRERAGNVKFVV